MLIACHVKNEIAGSQIYMWQIELKKSHKNKQYIKKKQGFKKPIILLVSQFVYFISMLAEIPSEINTMD